MAYNREMLRQKIKDSGLKFSALAEALSMTRSGLYKKIDSGTEFKPSQIRVMCEWLRLSEEERQQIFLI